MMRLIVAALLAFSLLFAANVRADQPAAAGGGYSATVPVTDTSDAGRDTALSAALAQVLQRVAPQAMPGADVLGQAPGLVRNYKYQRAASGNGLQLQVDFDPGSVQHLAQQIGASAATAAGSAAASSSGTAPVTGPSGSGTIWVDGLDSASDFATLLSTLRQSPQLHNVVPVAAQNDSVLLQLDYDTPLPEVLNALIAGGHLQNAPAHQGADASLHWIR